MKKIVRKVMVLTILYFSAINAEAQTKMTAEQYQKIVQMVPANLTTEQADYWIKNPDKFKALFNKIEENLLMSEKSAPVMSGIITGLDFEKHRISEFYLECLNTKVDWTKISIPTGPKDFKRMELILAGLTEDQIFEAYVKKFGQDRVWKAYQSISESIDRTEGGEPARPKGNYVILHRGGVEPDQEYLNKNYNDFEKDGNKYMIVKEGMITAFRYRFETGDMLDVKGVTRFHSLDADGDAMVMYRFNNDRLSIDRFSRVERYPFYGPRQVVF